MTEEISVGEYYLMLHVGLPLFKNVVYTIRTDYNDIGLYDTSSIESDILRYHN